MGRHKKNQTLVQVFAEEPATKEPVIKEMRLDGSFFDDQEEVSLTNQNLSLGTQIEEMAKEQKNDAIASLPISSEAMEMIDAANSLKENQDKMPPKIDNKKETIQGVPNTYFPVKTERDENGLIKDKSYVFKEGGRKVDWLAMIPKEYFVPNKLNFERRGEKVPTSVDGLENKDLLVLLEGFKYVADLRGFSDMTYVASCFQDYVCVVCQIYWNKNFETEMEFKGFSGVGDASPQNTNGFGRKFLGPIAENRAFVRTVRNFLRIPVLGSDEIAPNMEDQTETKSAQDPLLARLESLMELKKVSFEMIKNRLIKEKTEGAENFTSVKDLSKGMIFDMIERINKKKSTA